MRRRARERERENARARTRERRNRKYTKCSTSKIKGASERESARERERTRERTGARTRARKRKSEKVRKKEREKREERRERSKRTEEGTSREPEQETRWRRDKLSAITRWRQYVQSRSSALFSCAPHDDPLAEAATAGTAEQWQQPSHERKSTGGRDRQHEGVCAWWCVRSRQIARKREPEKERCETDLRAGSKKELVEQSNKLDSHARRYHAHRKIHKRLPRTWPHTAPTRHWMLVTAKQVS